MRRLIVLGSHLSKEEIEAKKHLIDLVVQDFLRRFGGKWPSSKETLARAVEPEEDLWRAIFNQYAHHPDASERFLIRPRREIFHFLTAAIKCLDVSRCWSEELSQKYVKKAILTHILAYKYTSCGIARDNFIWTAVTKLIDELQRDIKEFSGVSDSTVGVVRCSHCGGSFVHG